jgi:hypothetical protein
VSLSEFIRSIRPCSSWIGASLLPRCCRRGELVPPCSSAARRRVHRTDPGGRPHACIPPPLRRRHGAAEDAEPSRRRVVLLADGGRRRRGASSVQHQASPGRWAATGRAARDGPAAGQGRRRAQGALGRSCAIAGHPGAVDRDATGSVHAPTHPVRAPGVGPRREWLDATRTGHRRTGARPEGTVRQCSRRRRAGGVRRQLALRPPPSSTERTDPSRPRAHGLRRRAGRCRRRPQARRLAGRIARRARGGARQAPRPRRRNGVRVAQGRSRQAGSDDDQRTDREDRLPEVTACRHLDPRCDLEQPHARLRARDRSSSAGADRQAH